jgi:hypothetical protein
MGEQPLMIDPARIKAAQDYDLAHRRWGNWGRVPDEQVARLLAGADLYQASQSKTLTREESNTTR